MGRYPVYVFLLVGMVGCSGGNLADNIIPESELALLGMLAQVTPLMEMLQTSRPIITKRSVNSETDAAGAVLEKPEGRAIRRRPGPQQQFVQDRERDRFGNGYNDGFGEYASASSYGYGGGGHGGYGCCSQKKDELLPILALVALSLLLLYLIALATTTTTAAGGGGRRRRDIGTIHN